MSKPQANMPASTGGIMRYFSDYKSKIRIKPGHVVFATAILVLIVIMLHIIG